MDENAQKYFHDRAFEHGIELSRHQLHLIGIYLDELWEWNQKVNLTGISTRDRMLTELFLDSLIPAPFLPAEGRMLDVGSGAGFPGIPLKIYFPRFQTHLLEINSKRVSFLKQVIRLLKLDDISVIKGRIEKDGHVLHPEKYHMITARALADLDRIIPWCSPFLLPGGILITFLGMHISDTIRRCEKTMEKHALVLHKRITYRLPGKPSERNTVIFKKESSP